MTIADSAIASIPFAEALLDEVTLLPGLAEVGLDEPSTTRSELDTGAGLAALSAEFTSTMLLEDVSEVGDRSTSNTPNLENSSVKVVPTEVSTFTPSIAAAEGEPRVLKVDITSDENDGSATEGEGLSLRDAVLIANSTPEHEIIELESGKTYELAIEGKDPDDFFDGRDFAILGDLDVASTGGTLTIRTTGEDKATIDANQIHRVIQVQDDFRENAGTLVLRNVIITGGKAVTDDILDSGGGGIFVNNRARLEMSDCIVTGNIADEGIIPSGGGLSNDGTAVITRCEFTNNVSGEGGAIFSSYAVTDITDSIISGNSASRESTGSNIASGGGITHSGPGLLSVADSTITGNSTGFRGGGIAALEKSGRRGTLSVTNSTITGNTGADGGGIGIDGVEEATIDGSTIENNASTRSGGGIGVGSVLDTLTLSNSTVSNNTAGGNGGGLDLDGTISIRNVEIQNNSAGVDGGGISDSFATVSLDDSIIAGNTAGDAGGGMKGGSITRNTTIRDNVAGGLGGGISTISPGVIVNSTISGNSSGSFGGGLSIAGGPAGFYTVTIANSTISGNAAKQSGGGITVGGSTILDTPDYNNQIPGIDYTYEVVTFAGNVVVTNSTITNNTADSDGREGGGGGGINNAKSLITGGPDPANNSRTRFGSGKIALQNTILAGNFDGTPAGEGANEPDISGAAKGNANNLIGNLDGLTLETVLVAPAAESLGEGSDAIATNPGIGPLRDNGGATQTHALMPDSPAIDAGDNSAILPESFPSPNGKEGTIDFDFNEDGDSKDALPFDQRGSEFDRILNGTVDIGAFEGIDGAQNAQLPPLAFEPSIETIASSLTFATGVVSEQTPEAANNLLGGGDRVQPDEIPSPALIDYGISDGVTVEDTALMLAAYSLDGLGLDVGQLADAAGWLLGTPDAIASSAIAAIPTFS